MGTRGSVIIFKDNKQKETYNHFDSYPSGLGVEVIQELKKIDKVNGWKQFAANVSKVKLVSQTTKPSIKLQEKYLKFHNVSTGWPDEWYSLLRELQGSSYLPAIMSGEVEHMINSNGFVKDSLFCEYAYVIDLDKMVIEFYKGFQKQHQPGNRFGGQVKDDFYPCAKIGEMLLVGISKKRNAVSTMHKFYKAVEPKEEE